MRPGQLAKGTPNRGEVAAEIVEVVIVATAEVEVVEVVVAEEPPVRLVMSTLKEEKNLLLVPHLLSLRRKTNIYPEH